MSVKFFLFTYKIHECRIWGGGNSEGGCSVCEELRLIQGKQVVPQVWIIPMLETARPFLKINTHNTLYSGSNFIPPSGSKYPTHFGRRSTPKWIITSTSTGLNPKRKKKTGPNPPSSTFFFLYYYYYWNVPAASLPSLQCKVKFFCMPFYVKIACGGLIIVFIYHVIFAFL